VNHFELGTHLSWFQEGLDALTLGLYNGGVLGAPRCR
jgi:hypothetical protein